jgi:hypothetical protein
MCCEARAPICYARNEERAMTPAYINVLATVQPALIAAEALAASIGHWIHR